MYKLFENVRHIIKPGGSFIIADIIPEKPLFLKEIFTNLKSSIKSQCFFHTLKLYLVMRFGCYYKLHTSQPLLILPLSFFQAIAQDFSLKLNIFESPLTFNKNRLNLCYQF